MVVSFQELRDPFAKLTWIQRAAGERLDGAQPIPTHASLSITHTIAFR